MSRRRPLITAVTSVSSVTLAGAGLAGPTWAAAGQGASGQGQACSAGAHTLSPPGAPVYPDTGNGGYTRVPTDVPPVYEAPADKIPPRHHVVLTRPAPPGPTGCTPGFQRKAAQTAAG